jgi:peptide/nickel transport system ATP-binding protein
MINPVVSSESPILAIEDLGVAYRIEGAWYDVVRGATLKIAPRQVYGLVGESGSGKSTLALAAMRYLPANGRVTSGTVRLDGEDLLTKSDRDMRGIWGAKMNLVPQDPGASLNPSLHIGDQLAEIIAQHTGVSRREALKRGVDGLRAVRIADPDRVAKRYPHQLSGGMQQRVLIAMALSTDPRVLVLDEPTTNLDVTTEAVVLDLFTDLMRDKNAASLYVTHNLGVVAQVCDRAAVMYAGELVEDAPVQDLFKRPLHPYTMELLAAVPRPNMDSKLRTIKGTMPSRRRLNDTAPQGCIFAPRCPLALEYCFHNTPKPETASTGSNEIHTVCCHRWREIASGAIGIEANAPVTNARPHAASDVPLLDVQHVNKRYEVPRSVLDALRGAPKLAVKAVDDVSFDMRRGETIGLVGESGSGKTTLARVIVGLIERTSGKVNLLEVELQPDVQNRSEDVLRRLQMVFQNPDESLNPYQTIGEALRRPLKLLAKLKSAQVDERARQLLRAVHLPESYMDRLPSELSGGEKQRVAIARAFATDPELVVCDESVSALDVSVQASIINLLSELRTQKNIAYLFMSHDLAVVSTLADTIAVAYLGQLVEIRPRAKAFNAPLHPYTEALISAIPVPDPDVQTERIRLEASMPSPVNLPRGCRFHTRCPRKWGAICEQQ